MLKIALTLMSVAAILWVSVTVVLQGWHCTGWNHKGCQQYGVVSMQGKPLKWSERQTHTCTLWNKSGCLKMEPRQ